MKNTDIAAVAAKIDAEVFSEKFCGSKEHTELKAIFAKYVNNSAMADRVALGRYNPGSATHLNILSYGEDCYQEWADSNIRKAQKILNNFPGLVPAKKLFFEEVKLIAELLNY